MTDRQDAANDLLRAAARLNRWASQAAAFEIPYAQARLIALIDEMQPVRISALADADHSSQPSVTTQVQRLEHAGWVHRGADPADARATLVSLTDRGTAALAEVRAARARVLDPVLDRLHGPGLERVRDAVGLMTELLDLAAPQHHRPSSDHHRPSSDRDRPSSDHQRPSSDHLRPSSDHGRPSSDHGRPSSDHHGPSSNHQRKDV